MEKIKADYGDEVKYYTINELKDRFEEETDEWKENFFRSLEEKGVAYTNFAKYYKS